MMQQLKEKDGEFDEAIQEMDRLTAQVTELEKQVAASGLESTTAQAKSEGLEKRVQELEK